MTSVTAPTKMMELIGVLYLGCKPENHTGKSRSQPATIGNRVFIGAGAMIVGKITIGDDAHIFPGSVVTRSVPPRAVVMGYPARVVSHDGSFDLIIYDGMEHDPARRAALENAGADSQGRHPREGGDPV